jgi:hypothetical protein
MISKSPARNAGVRPQPLRLSCVVVSLAILSSCFPTPGRLLPTIDGPEDASLRAHARGVCVYVDPLGSKNRLSVLDLPSGMERQLELRGEPLSLSGPARDAHVVYVDRIGKPGRPDPTFTVSSVSLTDGSESVLHEEAGEILSERDVVCALAPSGTTIALIVAKHLGAFQFAEPELSLIDVASGGRRILEGPVSPSGLCWFPDERRLAIVGSRPGDKVRVTAILDLESGTRRVLCNGVVQTVSPDGASVLVAQGERLERVDVGSGTVVDSDVACAGNSSRWGEQRQLVVDLEGERMLCDGLPTTGTEQELVIGALGPGSAMWPIKLCEPKSGAFVTIIPHVWHGTPISFGVIEQR